LALSLPLTEASLENLTIFAFKVRASSETMHQSIQHSSLIKVTVFEANLAFSADHLHQRFGRISQGAVVNIAVLETDFVFVGSGGGGYGEEFFLEGSGEAEAHIVWGVIVPSPFHYQLGFQLFVKEVEFALPLGLALANLSEVVASGVEDEALNGKL
jgi:hypothetical protein